MNRKSILIGIGLAIAINLVLAYIPSLQDFDATYLSTNSNVVSIKGPLTNWFKIATNDLGSLGAQPTNANLSKWAAVVTNNIGALGAQPTNSNLTIYGGIATNGLAGQIGAQATNATLTQWSTIATNNIGAIGGQPTNANLTTVTVQPANAGIPLISDKTNVFWFDPAQYIIGWDDFTENATGVSGPYGPFGMVSRTANSGNVSNATGDTNHPGLLSLNSGAANGICNVCTPSTAFRLSGGYWDITWYVRTPSALAIDANYYELRVGLVAEDATSNIVNGVFFRYATNSATGSLNWQLVNHNNSAESVVDTTTNVLSTTYYKLRITVPADGSAATGYVNDDAGRSFSGSNIPTASGRELGLGAGIIATSFTTTRSFLLDYVRVYHKMNISR